ncbi:hypothetical protein Pmar_PMAR020223, partial [Perkinsus marinus ATCC 50983]
PTMDEPIRSSPQGDPASLHGSAADPEMAADLYRLAEIGLRALQSDPSSEYFHDPRK